MKSSMSKTIIEIVWIVCVAIGTIMVPFATDGSVVDNKSVTEGEVQTEEYGIKFYKVRFTVTDGSGMPVANALVRGTYPDLAKPQTYGSDEGITDVNGHVWLSVKADMGVFIRAMKDGYYQYGHTPGKKVVISRKEIFDGMEFPITMRRVINPIPLFARIVNVGDSKGGKIPEQSKWIGYDLEIGDWVQPFGEGVTTDIQFRYYKKFIKNPDLVGLSDGEKAKVFEKYRKMRGISFSEEALHEYLNSGYWEDFLDISFAGEGEGILQIRDEFLAECAMSMPHLAPITGYKSTLSNLSDIALGNSGRYNDDVGYFIRTRVILDANGEIVSANYAKIRGDFEFGPQGRLRYTYYFNPSANDRNLEFDVGKNLTDKRERKTYSILYP